MEGQSKKEDPRPSASPMGFPVTALLGPAGPLLRQLSSLSNSNMWEGTISWEEIRKLKEDLEKLCISLMHQSEAEEPLSSTAKLWMSEIRELCYDTKMYLDHAQCSPTQDDDYDDDDTQLTTKEKQETEEKLEEEKQEIARLKFKALQDRANRAKEYGIAEPSTRWKPELASTGRRLPVLHPELIDRGRMDNLAALLGNAQEKELKVVSLVGLEGVGKTTLAKRIYHTTGGQFVCRAFVRVSPNPDIRRLLSSIFRQIQSPGFSFFEGVSQPPCCLDAQDLIANIKDYLRDKRYFIIIDDLWSTSVWDIIRRAFPDGSFRSRMITTTRVNEVALACCSYQSKNMFEMEPLNYDQSQKLLFGIVFGSEDKDSIPEGMGEVISEIIEKCAGLPLSIVNIASLLPTKESKKNRKKWIDIRDSLLSMRSNPTSRRIMEILNLIYNNLSPELKTCLLYLVVYPEGYTVNKDDLVKQWVIEGLIGEGENQQEIAGRYFDELVSRGMIQAVDINYRGVVSCTLHHTVHDLIVKKSIEENFIISVDYFQSTIGLLYKVRRLSVQFGAARSARKPEGIMMSEVQSLAFFGFYGCADFMEECKLLRVLILHVWADQDKVPFDLSGIRNLLALRYLKITCPITVTLPDEIELLKQLEMLEVGATIVAIPPGIQYLSKLSSINIAVQALSEKDICILKRMYALTALSVDVKTTPTKWIVFGKGGFLVLKFFTFRCSAPRVRIEMNAMPIIKKLNLCFSAHVRKYSKKPITIEHMASLQEISVEILGAVSVKGSALTNVVTNNEKNPIPIVQLIESREDKEYEIMEEDYYSGKYEEEECSRMASTPTDAKIPVEAAPIPTGTIMEPLYLKVGLNSTCETFAEFIHELRQKVAEHPEKAVVHGYGPVLAKKQQQGKPARIVLINLMDDQNKRVELAVRDDNLELVGFKHSPRLWYEFPIEGKSMKLFTSSISVSWETSYVSLLGEAEDELEKLELGRMSAKSAIADLNKYRHYNSGSEQCARTKKALAKLMVMICESARFAPIYDTVKAGWEKDKGIFITKRQVRYINNWANISRSLLGRRSDAGIDDQADAVRALHLVHNPARPLVELFGVRASPDFSGTISIIDEENYKVTICERYEEGQFNNFNLDSLGRRRRHRRSYLHMEMQDLPLDATYRPVSSDGKISIQADSVNTYDWREDSKESMSVEANKIHQIQIHNVDFSLSVELKYGVLRDAVPKCLKVQLNLKEHKAPHVVSLHGEITVINDDFVGKSVLLFGRTEERAIQCEVTHTSDGLDVISVPLLRHFIAASLDKPLEIEVSLFATSSGYQNPITLKATLQFDPNTNSETKDIGAPGMEAHLMVTATDQETKPISLVSIIARGRSSRASIAQQKSIASQQKKGKESGV